MSNIAINGESQIKLPTKCPACKFEFKHLMMHLRNERCKKSLGQRNLSILREFYAKQSKKQCWRRYVKSGRQREVQARYREKNEESRL